MTDLHTCPDRELSRAMLEVELRLEKLREARERLQRLLDLISEAGVKEDAPPPRRQYSGQNGQSGLTKSQA